MSEPGDVIGETVRLLGALRRRMDGGPSAGAGRPAADDVWGRATHAEPVHHIATGAAECRYCPICRAIAATRESRPGLLDQVTEAGRSFFEAARDALAEFDRPPTGRPEPTPTGFSAARPREEKASPAGPDHPIDIG